MLHFLSSIISTHFYTKNTLRVNSIIFLINPYSVIPIGSFCQPRIISPTSVPCFQIQNSVFKFCVVFDLGFNIHFISNSNSLISYHFLSPNFYYKHFYSKPDSPYKDS